MEGGGLGEARRKVVLDGVALDACTEPEVVETVIAASGRGVGGWIVTVNVDILRSLRVDAHLRALIGSATLTVADGMPLIWAARVLGSCLPQRVTGASLLWSLSAAAGDELSIYLLGGPPGTGDRAAAALRTSCPGLRIAGTDNPPFGFDRDPGHVDEVVARVVAAAPDLVFCGLGFPRQEVLIDRLRAARPDAWYVGCGAAISFAAGERRRAPLWMQDWGLEWVHRLASEPRRLARRYLFDDLPYAAALFVRCAVARRRRGRASPAPGAGMHRLPRPDRVAEEPADRGSPNADGRVPSAHRIAAQPVSGVRCSHPEPD